MSYKTIPMKGYNCSNMEVIKYNIGEIKSFKYCIEITFKEFNSYELLSLNLDKFFLEYFFNGKENFINLYKEQLSEVDIYYVDKCIELNIFDFINVSVDTNELNKTKRINFNIGNYRFDFIDKQLDKYDGDVERMLKVKRLAKNIEGF